jgi:hypothetical protein
MIIYQDAKIYKLVSQQTDNIYIGATCETLSNRFNGHKMNYKRNVATTSNYIVQYSDCKIILIENWPCNNKEELNKRLWEHWDNNKKSVNNLPSIRKKKSGEEIKIQYSYADPRYWETKICTCGGTTYVYATTANTSHSRTKRHQRNVNYMQILEEDNVTIKYNYFAKKSFNKC